ncbi:MAG: AAA family ATPase [Patescibacteria group bacterium]|nr:AAA family ATPase [Patescibacteria group bacterium]
MSQRLILGITGTFSSGKDTVANYLEKKGFFHLSLADLVREECQKKNCYYSRDDLVKEANELRKKYGPGILAKMALERIRDKEKIVISSIRNPGEIEELKKEGRFFLLALEAPIELRYERAKKRGKIDDAVSFEKFKRQEELERKGNEFQQQLDQVISLADFRIVNDSSLEELYKKVEEVLNKIKISH